MCIQSRKIKHLIIQSCVFYSFKIVGHIHFDIKVVSDCKICTCTHKIVALFAGTKCNNLWNQWWGEGNSKEVQV